MIQHNNEVFNIVGLPERKNCCGTCNYRPPIFETPEEWAKMMDGLSFSAKDKPHRCHHNENMVCAGSLAARRSGLLQWIQAQKFLRMKVLGL